MGYLEAFGTVLAMNLKSAKAMDRMTNYLVQVKPKNAEEIIDEMLAIVDNRERWVQKKSAEYYNSKYNELLWNGFGEDDENKRNDREGYSRGQQDLCGSPILYASPWKSDTMGTGGQTRG